MIETPGLPKLCPNLPSISPHRKIVITGSDISLHIMFDYRKFQLQVEVYVEKINCLYKTFS